MRLIYLQLPLFTKKAKECETLFDKMIYVLKNMDALQRHPELFNGPVFTWLAQISDEASLSKEERIKYDAALKAYRDTYAVMEGQYEEGMKKGMEKTNRYNAIKMKELGLTTDVISQVTGLSVEDIKRL
jgi:predicted transposase/invertase (TIGR01784 family)